MKSAFIRFWETARKVFYRLANVLVTFLRAYVFDLEGSPEKPLAVSGMRRQTASRILTSL